MGEHARPLEERGCDPVAHEHAAERHVRRADALCERDDVGADVVALGCEPVAQPAEAGDDLVGHEQHAVFVADRTHALEVALGRRERPARVLHRLHEHGRDRFRPLLLDHGAQLVEQEGRELRLGLALGAAVGVGVRHVADARQQRLERRLDRGDPGQRQRAQGGAVVGQPAGDHLVAAVLAAQLVVLARPASGSTRWPRSRPSRRTRGSGLLARARRSWPTARWRGGARIPSWCRTAARPSGGPPPRRARRRSCIRSGCRTGRRGRRNSACRSYPRASSPHRG